MQILNVDYDFKITSSRGGPAGLLSNTTLLGGHKSVPGVPAKLRLIQSTGTSMTYGRTTLWQCPNIILWLMLSGVLPKMHVEINCTQLGDFY